MQRINPAEDSQWKALLAAQPKRSFFHTAEWAKVLTDTYGYAPVCFGSGEGGGTGSWLPLMEVDSWLTGRRGISLPFTDECEPLCAEGDTFQKLFQEAVEFGKSRGWKHIEIRGGRELLHEVPASLSFYGHTLDLSAPPDELFSRLQSPVRRAIRKAEKSGVSTEILGTEEAMRIFYGLHCRTRKKHGQPPQPIQFFLNIHRHIVSQNQGMVVLARHQGKPIAGAVYFHSGEQAIYKFGASDDQYQELRGSNLVMWTAIAEYARRGVKRLDFGRTSLANAGLRKFKLGWGTAERTIEYVKFDLRKNQYVLDTDGTSGWQTPVFRRLPGVLSRAAGAVLYRHWA